MNVVYALVPSILFPKQDKWDNFGLSVDEKSSRIFGQSGCGNFSAISNSDVESLCYNRSIE